MISLVSIKFAGYVVSLLKYGFFSRGLFLMAQPVLLLCSQLMVVGLQGRER